MDTVAGGVGFLLGYLLRLVSLRERPMESPEEDVREEVQPMLAGESEEVRPLDVWQAKLRILATALVGFVLFVATVGILVLAFLGREVPPALSAIAGTAMGALVSQLTGAGQK